METQVKFRRKPLKFREGLKNQQFLAEHPLVQQLFSYTPKQKIHIKFLTAFNYYKDRRYYQFAVATDSYEYIEFDMLTNGDPALYQTTVTHLKKMFSAFVIDRETTVVLSPTINVAGDPVKMYFNILQSMIQFNIRYVPILDMIKRLSTYYTGIVTPRMLKYRKNHSFKKSDVNTFWKAFV